MIPENKRWTGWQQPELYKKGKKKYEENEKDFQLNAGNGYGIFYDSNSVC